MCLLLVVLSAIVGLINAQVHHNPLHGICHSNHLQMTEDQVITNVVNAMETNHDGVVQRVETLLFFASLMGADLTELRPELENLTNEELLHHAGSLNIQKHDFVTAWHNKFHDNMEFIGATFDIFDTNKDEALNAVEIENVVNMALVDADINHDSQLEVAELVAFLERGYLTEDKT